MGLTLLLDAQDYTLNASLYAFEEFETLKPLSINQVWETAGKTNPMIASKPTAKFLAHTQQGDTCRSR